MSGLSTVDGDVLALRWSYEVDTISPCLKFKGISIDQIISDFNSHTNETITYRSER
jgi:hypothetical protein